MNPFSQNGNRPGRLRVRVLATFASLGLGTLFAAEAATPLYVPEPALEEGLARALRVPRDELTQELVAAKLLRFELNGAGLRDLTGLEHAVNLQTLTLRDNLIENVTPITGLANLRRLDLSGNRIASLLPFKDMTRGAIAARIVQIRAAVDAPRLRPEDKEKLRQDLIKILVKSRQGPWRLEELILARNRVRGLMGIGNHVDISLLDLSHNSLLDLEGVSRLRNLRSLRLQGNQLGVPEPFEDKNKNGAYDAPETYVDANRNGSYDRGERFTDTNDNQVRDAGDPFTDVSGNGLRDHDPLSELRDLPRLRELYLYDNNLVDLSSIGKLPALDTLLLSGNRLTNVTGLRHLVSLRRLSLVNNHLSDVRGLVELVNLEYLHLTENRLGDLRALRKLTALRELHLEYNHLTDLRPLADLRNLRVLGLTGNFVRSVAGIESLSNLRRLNLGDNHLSLVATQTSLAIERLEAAGTRATLGSQSKPEGELHRLVAVLMGDKVANKRLGDYLKGKRYERLGDYARDATIPPEEKAARYLRWAETLRSDSFDPKAPLRL